MRAAFTATIAALAIAALAGCSAEPEPESQAATQMQEQTDMSAEPPAIAADQQALLQSSEPKLAANKKLVYDMYRIVLQAGLAGRAGEFIAEDYIQHNPNAEQGLAGVQDYIRKTRPEREITDTLELPLIHLMAEGDYVTIAFVRPEKDANGQTYYSTWFDLFRIENGKIAEHWDPMLKSDVPVDPNDKKI
jgi:predicted SnoaL-like aldol condensation-catalyzing enzyme